VINKSSTEIAGASAGADRAGASETVAESGPSQSRRAFLSTAVVPLALAAGGAGALASRPASAAAASAIPSIRVPKEIQASLDQAPIDYKFTGKGLSGAEVFAKLCKEENLAALFCCPGNYTVIHALAAAGIPTYGGRTEGSMAAAADGFSRVTGEVVACSGTEGPGFTHMIQSIAAANSCSTPLLVLASNVQFAGEDTGSGLQRISQQPITQELKKYGKRLTAPNRVHEYGGIAFRYLKSGVPGPVHLDFPGEAASTRFKDSGQLTAYYDKTRYRSEATAVPSEKDLAAAVSLINKSERPLLIAGQGVFYRKAWDALKVVVEKHEMAVCSSGPVRGHFPDEHRLSASLSPSALMSADLIIFVGQYNMPTPLDYRVNPDIKAIRVHPIPDELGRNWPLDVGVVSEEKAFLEALENRLAPKKRDTWVNEIAAARKDYEAELNEHYTLGLKYTKDTGAMHPAVIGQELHNFLYKGKIDPKQTTVGWGGFSTLRFVPTRLRYARPGQGMVCPYQFGAIGPDLSLMLGATVAVKEGIGPQAAYKGAPTLVMTTDAGMGFSMLEVDTAVKYRLPLISVVYNNNAWGTWAFPGDSPRGVQLHLFQENLRYDLAAEALGCRGEYVRSVDQFRAALARAYEHGAKESLPTLINVQSMKEYTSAALYPPGQQIPSDPGIAGLGH
jgi:thiamine pyrophosphate-dependent acetolactate synthase large subunit-like protein